MRIFLQILLVVFLEQCQQPVKTETVSSDMTNANLREGKAELCFPFSVFFLVLDGVDG
jgi:hypothetical protein